MQKTLRTEFIDSLRSIVERTASVYRASDHVGLEICARKIKLCFEKDVRYFKCVQDSSKGEPSIGILGKHRRKTGVHYHKENDRETS